MKHLGAFVAGFIIASGMWYCAYYDATHVSTAEMVEWGLQ